MSEGSQSSSRSAAALRRVGREMSPWTTRLLLAFLVMAGVGAALWVPAWLKYEAPADTAPMASDPSPDAARSSTNPPGSQGFVDGTGGAESQGSTPAKAAEPDYPWTADLGGWLFRIGLSFAGGIVLGVFFRAFLKTMAMITAVVAAGLVALSYFEVLNIDFTTMRQNYDTYSAWISDQAYKFKDLIVSFLPSFGAAAVGFFFGFIRR